MFATLRSLGLWRSRIVLVLLPACLLPGCDILSRRSTAYETHAAGRTYVAGRMPGSQRVVNLLHICQQSIQQGRVFLLANSTVSWSEHL
ncbi:hypothetical protein BJX68DRAFT_226712, partial [Aspergillus pseudodeflectus]